LAPTGGSFIGLELDSSSSCENISVAQERYVNEILKAYDCENLVKTPKSVTMRKKLDKYDDIELKRYDIDANIYRELVRDLQYLGIMSRPDILSELKSLVAKSDKPTLADLKRAYHILKYIAGTKKAKLIFSRGSRRICTDT
jgi:hypothetical protein